ncbi:MAG: L-glutamate gamma-semialdehyde dehydrogenase, partial [Smithellaceae bacterium]|nr:L-glutamate gamma-semialdehyde dehydrogenase [Smithellaceae bacterium]
IVIGGEKIRTNRLSDSLNPSNIAEVVGRVCQADAALAEKAIQVADETFLKTWRRFPAEARARILIKAAAMMRRRKLELSAWLVVEAGKNWAEAATDTAEAIDFLEYYARGMMDYAGIQKNEPWPGEENCTYWEPLGVCVVIPPWNFPCAILAGMTAAAIVTGNTVVLKPASITPVIGAIVSEIFHEAGLPPGVLNFLPGGGGEIGDLLVDHPLTRMIVFTGSKEVGLRIAERSAKIQKGQIWIKRLVAEMGGKDTIVVDETASLDEAAREICLSAYGYQGQKCSACSRVVAVGEVHDLLLEKVTKLAESLTIGDPREQENYLGAVSSAGAFASIMGYIETGKKEHTLVTGGEPGPEEGYFIKPTIFRDVKPRDRLAQEEIFGPVLAFIRAENFTEAIAIANNTEYGLTGAVFSNVRERLEYARREFQVGNLYFNRKCTGALVGVQPFGGFNMSGTDSKAGGKEYLLLFMQGKSVTERF